MIPTSSKSTRNTAMPSAERVGSQLLWIGPKSHTSAAEAMALQRRKPQISIRWQDPGEPLPKLDGVATIIVAGDARLCGDLLHTFTGRIIYRSYGERVKLGDELWASGARRLIEAGRPITFVTDSDLSRMPLEETWIVKRATHAPRWLDENVDAHLESWRSGGHKILIPVPPELTDDRDDRLLRRFAELYFSDSDCVRYPISSSPMMQGLNPRINMDRAERNCGAVISLFHQPGYFPYELLNLVMIGMPLIYFPGCFLSHCIGAGGPGEVTTIEQSLHLARRVALDRSLADALVQAQRPLMLSHNPQISREKFEQVMVSQIDNDCIEQQPSREMAMRIGSREGEQAMRLAYDLFESADRDLVVSEAGSTRFVRTLYNVFLEREPDDEGLEAYRKWLRANKDLPALARDILASEEFKSKQVKNRLFTWLRS